MLHSDKYSYVRYPSPAPDKPLELLFDLENDPDEKDNPTKNPKFAKTVSWHRNRLIHILETHPPVQTAWAPLPPNQTEN